MIVLFSLDKPSGKLVARCKINRHLILLCLRREKPSKWFKKVKSLGKQNKNRKESRGKVFFGIIQFWIYLDLFTA